MLIHVDMTSLIGAFRVYVTAQRMCIETSGTSATNSYIPELNYVKSTAYMFVSENKIIKSTIFVSHHKTFYQNYRTRGKDWKYLQNNSWKN